MANVSIRMDDNLKKQAEDLFNDLGMNLTTAFTIFVKQAIREQGIPFEITREIPNSETISAINEVQQMKFVRLRNLQSIREVRRMRTGGRILKHAAEKFFGNE